MQPLAYRRVLGAFAPEDRIELVFDKFRGNRIFLKATLFMRTPLDSPINV